MLTCCCLSPQSSYIEVTPSPNKLLTEHPLTAFVKTEEEEEEQTSCSVTAAAAAAAVKQEVEKPELIDVKKEEEVLTDDVQSEQSQV